MIALKRKTGYKNKPKKTKGCLQALERMNDERENSWQKMIKFKLIFNLFRLLTN